MIPVLQVHWSPLAFCRIVENTNSKSDISMISIWWSEFTEADLSTSRFPCWGHLLRSIPSSISGWNCWIFLFVALSYEYNLQIGCLWWKISTSSLKTYFTNLVLTFVNLVSRQENCNFPRFTWWKVDEPRKMHWVTHIFNTDNKKPLFSKIGQHLGTPERF